MQVEEFIPNRYCASCPEGSNVWEAKCRSARALIFYGGTETEYPSDWVSDACRGGCGKTHTFELEPGTVIEPNCWIITSINSNSAPANYPEYFTRASSSFGETHWQLTEAGLEHYLAAGELLPAYYNSDCLDGGSWLVTEDLMHIHPTS